MIKLLRLASVASLFAIAALGAGCTGSATCRTGNCGSPDAGTVKMGPGLSIDPVSAMITVNGGPQPQQFRAYFDGADITDSATWTIDDKTVGIISRGLFTSNYPLVRGGLIRVGAVYMGQVVSAALTISYVAPAVVDKGAPLDSKDWFGGGASADPNETPVVVYPLDGVMLPRNLSGMNVQWKGSQKSRVFHVHIVGQNIEASFFIGQNACKPTQVGTLECQYQPTGPQWQSIALSAAGVPLTITVSSVQNAGGEIAYSAPVTANVSPEDVRGGFYWFSPSINGIKRLPFGAEQATDFISFAPNSGNCAGCHAISRDGKKVAATFYGGDGTGGVVDGANGKKYLVKPEPGAGNAVKRWNFATFNPDGTLLLTNWAGVFTLRDGNTGSKKFDIPENVVGGKGIMPEWSPDGTRVAFVKVPPEGRLGKDMAVGNLQAGDWIAGNTGDIAVMKFDKGEFFAAETIVPSVKDTEYHFYPTWSPDNEWLLFVSGRWPGSSDTAAFNLFGFNPKNYTISYDQTTARLRLVRAEANAPVIELNNATFQMNKTASWPKFTPFVQAQGTLVFFTYSAKWNYGYVVTDGKTPQLWMAAIDLQRARTELGASDPSFTPFWLPFQDPQEKNHSGIWTNEIACNMDIDCPIEFSCMAGTCKEKKIGKLPEPPVPPASQER